MRVSNVCYTEFRLFNLLGNERRAIYRYVSTNDLSFYYINLLSQESLVCIFESPRLVALFNSTRTDETALHNLNKVVHAFVMHIDGLSRARQIV